MIISQDELYDLKRLTENSSSEEVVKTLQNIFRYSDCYPYRLERAGRKVARDAIEETLYRLEQLLPAGMFNEKEILGIERFLTALIKSMNFFK